MESIFSKQIHPFKQLTFALIAGSVIMLISKALMSSGSISSNNMFFWELSFSLLLCFALFNCIFSVPYVKRGEYFSTSLMSFAVVGVVSGALAYWLSGISVDDAGSVRWLYIVFTFSYLVFISIVNAMRKIIEIAKKQDARLRGEDV